jgi:hypothetical protein
VEVGRRVRLCADHGIDALVYGLFWCRGKRVFEAALDQGYLGSPAGASFPFAVMWANRMPRRVLPVRQADLPVIDAGRLVPSDEEDFVQLIATVAERYFRRGNYLTVEGLPYFSIFDATFFVRELGLPGAARAIAAARRWLRDHGLPGMHLAAIEPQPDLLGEVAALGFDSVTNYVLLPYWRGPFLQDYDEVARRRAGEWAAIAAAARLPYMPSVAPGWDASPRGADFGPRRPDKYPWSPVVVGEHPRRFAEAVGRASEYAAGNRDEHLVFLASLNEWSEGHYLEPDTRFGYGWLEAVRDGRR